jgi:methyl-accepting chemotaxis protein
MKTKLLLLSALLFGSTLTIAQDDAVITALETAPQMSVEQSNIKFQKKPTTAFTAYVKSSSDDVEKAWKSFISDKYGVDLKKSKGALMGEAVQMPGVSEFTVNFFTMIETDEKGARMDVLMSIGDKFVASNTFPTETGNIQKMIRTFLHDFYVTQYDEVIEDQRKEQEKLTKSMDKLVKEGEKLVKNTEGKEADILKAEENITKTEKLIADSQVKIEQLKADIENYRKEIEQLKKETENNTKAAEEVSAKVAKQAERIDRLKRNADSIKSSK